jgi:negative regulator of sigma E activity
MSDDLSRLLDGELPPDEAAALRARIATDPALAARWARMQALGGQLRALPREIPRPRRRRFETPRWAGWAVAAAALLFTLGRPVPARVLVEGMEVVEGRADVLAGDVLVEVDGKVSIGVEPPGGQPRVVASEVTPMDKKNVFAALAGSIVTVAVLQGSATLHPADAAPIALQAGETHTVGGRAQAPPVPTPRSAASTDPRVADLERELDRAKLERALAVGQLRRHEGVAQEWPENLPAIWKPEGYERFLRDRVATIPDAEIVAIDCEEYPCVALVRSHSAAADWEDKLMPLHDDLEGAGFGDNLHVIGMGHDTELATDDGPVSVKLYGFAVAPGDGDDALMQRVKFRTESAMEDADEELRQP